MSLTVLSFLGFSIIHLKKGREQLISITSLVLVRLDFKTKYVHFLGPLDSSPHITMLVVRSSFNNGRKCMMYIPTK